MQNGQSKSLNISCNVSIHALIILEKVYLVTKNWSYFLIELSFAETLEDVITRVTENAWLYFVCLSLLRSLSLIVLEFHFKCHFPYPIQPVINHSRRVTTISYITFLLQGSSHHRELSFQRCGKDSLVIGIDGYRD